AVVPVQPRLRDQHPDLFIAHGEGSIWDEEARGEKWEARKPGNRRTSRHRGGSEFGTLLPALYKLNRDAVGRLPVDAGDARVRPAALLDVRHEHALRSKIPHSRFNVVDRDRDRIHALPALGHPPRDLVLVASRL